MSDSAQAHLMCIKILRRMWVLWLRWQQQWRLRQWRRRHRGMRLVLKVLGEESGEVKKESGGAGISLYGLRGG
jgi:hypothetical protein